MNESAKLPLVCADYHGWLDPWLGYEAILPGRISRRAKDARLTTP